MARRLRLVSLLLMVWVASVVLTPPIPAAADDPISKGYRTRWLYQYHTWQGGTFDRRGVGEYCEVWVMRPWGGVTPPDRVISDEQVTYLIEAFDTLIYPETVARFGAPNSRVGDNPTMPWYDWSVYPSRPCDYHPEDGRERVIIMVHHLLQSPTPGYLLTGYGYYGKDLVDWHDRNIIGIDDTDWAYRLGSDTAPWRGGDPARNLPHLLEATVAHDLALLIQNDRDPDEEQWVKEVLAWNNAERLGLVDLGGDAAVPAYLGQPSNSMMNPAEAPTAINFGWGMPADKGANLLFGSYLEQRFGPDLMAALAGRPENGVHSFDLALAELGHDCGFADVYQDFTVAALINSRRPANRYYFREVDGQADVVAGAGTVARAWGPCYVVFPGQPKIEDIAISGIELSQPDWAVVDDPLAPPGTNRVLHSGNGNLQNRAVYAVIDLTGTANPVLSFRALYNIETGWDFGMVQVSEDGGNSWTSLANASTTSVHDSQAHPAIIANLPGFTGYSGGWTEQSFDLGPYAGRRIMLAFRYMTDWLVEGAFYRNPFTPGFYIDDIAVSGTTLACDGSSLDPLGSMNQVLGLDLVISFLGELRNANAPYRVLHLDAARVTGEGTVELERFLHDAALEEVTMIVSYGPADESHRTVAFDYLVERKLPPAPAPAPETKAGGR